jgi:hypothetical protein
MGLWYKFLLVLFLIGISPTALFFYLLYTNNPLSRDLFLPSLIAMAVLFAMGALYYERWRRKWWKRCARAFVLKLGELHFTDSYRKFSPQWAVLA